MFFGPFTFGIQTLLKLTLPFMLAGGEGGVEWRGVNEVRYQSGSVVNTFDLYLPLNVADLVPKKKN